MLGSQSVYIFTNRSQEKASVVIVIFLLTKVGFTSHIVHFSDLLSIGIFINYYFYLEMCSS